MNRYGRHGGPNLEGKCRDGENLAVGNYIRGRVLLAVISWGFKSSRKIEKRTQREKLSR